MEAVFFLLLFCLDGFSQALPLDLVQHSDADNGSDNGYIGRDLFRVLCVGGVMVTSAVFVMLCLRCREPPRDYEAPASPRDYEAPASPRDYEEPDSPTPPAVSTELDVTNVDSEADQTPLRVVDTGESNSLHSTENTGSLLVQSDQNGPSSYEKPKSVTYENVALKKKPEKPSSSQKTPEDEGYYAVPRAITDPKEESYYDTPNPTADPKEESYYDTPNPTAGVIQEAVYDVPKPHAGGIDPAVKEEPQGDLHPIPLPRTESSSVKKLTSIVIEREKYSAPPDSVDEILQAFKEVDCPNVMKEQIKAGKKLGVGHFSIVHKAEWNHMDETLEVAWKKIKPRSTQEDRVKFFQEAHIMAQFDHPNIVKVLGVTGIDTNFRECGIVTELLPNGDLLSYLRIIKKHVKAYSQEDLSAALMICAKQVASGMQYLANKGFVHRDLAARNILLDNDYHCKICDFGLARDLGDIDYYRARKGEIPVKWTAPEALGFRKYTTASDVWSFGILLYEMWSLGAKPMSDVPNGEVVQRLFGGYRMPPPPGCPRGIYKLMIKCWHKDPDKRPGFTMIHGVFQAHGEQILRSNSIDPGAPSEAYIIGADLSVASNLYRELQATYM